MVVWQYITGDRLARKAFGYKLEIYYYMDTNLKSSVLQLDC